MFFINPVTMHVQFAKHPGLSNIMREVCSHLCCSDCLIPRHSLVYGKKKQPVGSKKISPTVICYHLLLTSVISHNPSEFSASSVRIQYAIFFQCPTVIEFRLGLLEFIWSNNFTWGGGGALKSERWVFPICSLLDVTEMKTRLSNH